MDFGTYFYSGKVVTQTQVVPIHLTYETLTPAPMVLSGAFILMSNDILVTLGLGTDLLDRSRIERVLENSNYIAQRP